ncbi:MAG TPA: hypothetical protein DCS07_13000 [Bdellovibrionales bacterium]|nr:MAG: hypothetical protein A2Z97_04950 [Bdellovibrionales bacterium GWB1_52_6]OFZ39477.1 MAG: hypothetical protein A2070_06690 [Bdellovibrionales bacterium GWC1_52_8]HAR43525.1 hypothetical protein [Bdellovibrionales bacterium]HCM39678.1 hypothetical protein [Bdellovibrionales bacterium]
MVFAISIGKVWAGTSGAISIPDPKTGEWCLFGVEHLGPRKLSVGETGKYVVRLENRSACTLKHLRMLDKFPKDTDFKRADPQPSKIRNRRFPHGPILYWNQLKSRPGDIKTFEVELQVTGARNQILKNRICLSLPRDAEEVYCHYFKIRVLP